MRPCGRGTVLHLGGDAYRDALALHFGGHAPLGTRQIVTMDFATVQTSCGYGVPFFDYVGDRTSMDRWADGKGEVGIEAYWREKNLTSIDGLPTGLLDGPKARDP